jgi:hypothetical protein
MANHLRMAMIQAIVTLHQRGWSKRRIARELRADWNFCARCFRIRLCSQDVRFPLPGWPGAYNRRSTVALMLKFETE